MDHDTCKSISKLIVKISTNSKDSLDDKLMKELINYAGQSPEYLKYTHGSLLKQLEKKHSEIRLGAFLIINEFFKKSSFYRELLLDDFRKLLDLTVGPHGKPLPPPVEAAKSLKLRTLQAFETWHSRFLASHQRLHIAYNYIKTVLKINFEDSLKRNAEEIERAFVEQERARNAKLSRLDILLKEVEEHECDISQLITQMKNCFSLVISKPEEFLGDIGNKQTKDKNDDENEIDFSEHGINSRSTITIQFNPESATTVEQTEDNEAVLENLKGLYAVATNRYFPLVHKWLLVASKLDDDTLLKKVTDLKEDLLFEINTFKKLNLIPISTDMPDDDDTMDSTDDSDFEEVPEKVGYEEFAVAPPVPVRKTESDLPPVASTSSSSWSILKPQRLDECDDPTYGLKPDALKAVLMNNCDKPSTSGTTKKSNSSVSNPRKDKLLKMAPKLPFDIDLYHWEDEKLRAPVVELADTGSHRFWQPIDREGETIENPDGVGALRTRVIEFSGDFEPVKWKCRAPLPTGKLCPRQDRIKCPLHGKIIARDEEGNPTKPEDIARLAEEKKKEDQQKVPDWQEPKFLKDLQAQIGIDLTIRKPKKGGKTYAEKFPNLTDIRKLKDTPRSRLEKKIFSKQAIKRVANSIDDLNRKRHKDKFGDQFNYIHDT